MGKGSNLYFQQQQARQLREMEKHQAAQSGQPLRKLTWTERNVLGLKDEPSPLSSEPGGESMLVRAKEEAEARRLDREQEKRARKEAMARGAEEVPTSARTIEGAGPRMELVGDMIEVTWDGRTLTVVASNKVAQFALRGQDHGKGALTLPADEIASTELKPPGALTNGRITIRTKDRRTYLLNFRRKSTAEFARLYKALPG